MCRPINYLFVLIPYYIFQLLRIKSHLACQVYLGSIFYMSFQPTMDSCDWFWNQMRICIYIWLRHWIIIHIFVIHEIAKHMHWFWIDMTYKSFIHKLNFLYISNWKSFGCLYFEQIFAHWIAIVLINLN